MEQKIELENEALQELHPDYEREILLLLGEKNTPQNIRQKLLTYHENDIASAAENLSPEDRKKLFRLLGAADTADVLEYTEFPNVFLSQMSQRMRLAVLSHLEAPVVAEYIESLPEEERGRFTGLLDEETREDLSLVLRFDEDEIGSKMSTNFIAVSENATVRQAMKTLVGEAAENDNISTIYVTDEKGGYLGAIPLKDLILARENTPLSQIIISSYPYVFGYEEIEDCVMSLREYSEDSIPVLDSENRLIGVLILEEVMDLLEEEFSEDYAKLAGLLSPDDLEEPVGKSLGKRLPWLVILLGLGLLVSGVVGMFEEVVKSLAVIVSFQSLILGMAGNAGTQSLAVTVRVLSYDDLERKQKISLVGKEIRLGLLNGVILGLLSFGLIGLYLILVKGESAAFSFSVSTCTALALVISILLSSLSGTVIPLFFQKMKIDPAVASGPLITTLNDLVAVVSYYGLAWAFLIGVMGF